MQNKEILLNLWLKEKSKLPNVSHETFEDLYSYIEYLLKWNKSFNLVSKQYNEDVRKFWAEQILPCLNLYHFIQNNNYKEYKIIDLGSGAGLPGLVLAILGIGNIITVDRRNKKINFQQYIIRELNLENRVKAICEDIQSLEMQEAKTLIVSKAVADATDIIKLTNHLLKPYDQILLLKNQSQLGEFSKIDQVLFDTSSHTNIFNNKDSIFQIQFKSVDD